MKCFPLAALLIAPLVCAAQTSPAPGKAIFRSNCAFCHGLTGTGGRGPSLVSAHFKGLADDDVKTIVQHGIPGTGMPGFDGFDAEELTQLVAFLRSLGTSAGNANHPGGNATHGASVYAASGCAGCHRIGESGGLFGPELTRVGGARSWDYLKQSIVDPSADIPPEYETVTVTTQEGRKVTGIRINEDTFSVQLRLPNGAFFLAPKASLRNVSYSSKSAMPAYASIPERDLNDLLAYLETLRGPATGSETGKAAGVH